MGIGVEAPREPLGLPELRVRLSLARLTRIIEFGFIVTLRQEDSLVLEPMRIADPKFFPSALWLLPWRQLGDA